MNVLTKDRMYKVLLAPRITEKTTTLANTNRQVVFQVAKDANKQEIKVAVETLFNVAVEKVRVVNIKGKERMFRQMPGRRNHIRKAYVSLKEGHDINFAGKE